MRISIERQPPPSTDGSSCGSSALVASRCVFSSFRAVPLSLSFRLFLRASSNSLVPASLSGQSTAGRSSSSLITFDPSGLTPEESSVLFVLPAPISVPIVARPSSIQ
ncbi:hypothetical protein M758_2G065900 [Ceratodon purpureus]|nr:hypothetical protein M758_2G065900 [Ceratodon purpureus]